MAVVLHTTAGDLPVLLHYQTCPLACFNFLALCASGYYDGCHFYRHFPSILLQTGDPTNSGKGGESVYATLPSSSAETGGGSLSSNNSVVTSLSAAGVVPGRYFRDEGFGETTHAQRGVLSMAHKGTKPNTNASQFFVTTSPQPAFDGVYTAFAAVDLNGAYDAATSAVVNVPPSAVSSAKTDTASGTASGSDAPLLKSGDAVLQALEEAAATVDAKNFVVNAAEVRITAVTVLYNPFAEGKAKP